jgi:hypothetical protein
MAEQTAQTVELVRGPRTDQCVSCEQQRFHYLTLGPGILICNDCADALLSYWLKNRWFRKGPTGSHTARLHDATDGGRVIVCSCKRWSMVGGSKKGLRSAHAVHCAENGESPAWFVRLVGLGGSDA